MRSMRLFILGLTVVITVIAQDGDIDLSIFDAPNDTASASGQSADSSANTPDSSIDIVPEASLENAEKKAATSDDSQKKEEEAQSKEENTKASSEPEQKSETAEKQQTAAAAAETTSSSQTSQPAVTPEKETAAAPSKTAEAGTTSTGAKESAAPTSAEKQPSATAPSAQPQESPVSEGFDTVDISEPSGNWLYKRIWWEKAQGRYERIQDLMNKIFDARTPFLTKKAEAEQTIFDPLLLKTGLTQGELATILTDINQEIEALKAKQEGTLTVEQKEFLQLISNQQNQLKQLQLDVEALSKVDNELEVDVEKLMQQINRARSYEHEAWDHLNTIAKALSDAQARRLYFAIETNQKNIQDILNYIATAMTDHFDTLLKVAKEQSERIIQSIQGLKEKGIDFKKRAQEIEKKVAQAEQEQQKKQHQEELEKAVERAKAESSWSGKIGRVWSGITSGLETVWHNAVDTSVRVWQWIKGLFGSSQIEEKTPEKVTPEVTQEKEVQSEVKAKKEAEPEAVAQESKEPAIKEQEIKQEASTIEAPPKQEPVQEDVKVAQESVVKTEEPSSVLPPEEKSTATTPPTTVPEDIMGGVLE